MKSLEILGIFLSGAILFASCESAPKSDEAKTGEAQKVDSTKAAEAQTLKVDVANSVITWVGTKPTGKHNGTFALSEGSVSVKEGKIVGGKFVIDVKSLKVLDIPETEKENAKLTGHLKSPDFLDAEKFPTATFEVVSVEPYKADTTQKVSEKDKEYTLENPTHSITGNLTMKGVTKSITFPAIVKLEGGKMEAEAKFNINRKDWGMEWGITDKLISNTVHMGFKISAGVAK
ncbi:YceI family protein [Raineya orbicola]|jgi:polyisoprenoid-binding protein YceI|uniref:YceI-like domain n=1 Tax=Raineya orbicola TaxID=2016530 RepID=A0A2N3IHI8_9BACT|nr:YceI family protein [Raineya orbicola]PKQ69766.1 YceI-like domain [Raineya orbicola]